MKDLSDFNKYDEPGQRTDTNQSSDMRRAMQACLDTEREADVAATPAAVPVEQGREALPSRWHELKTDPDVFDAVADGRKTFEIRLNDRGYRVGDGLLLRRTRHSGRAMSVGMSLEYTGEELRRVVTHVLVGPVYGLTDGWAILSIAAPQPAGAAGGALRLERIEALAIEAGFGHYGKWRLYQGDVNALAALARAIEAAHGIGTASTSETVCASAPNCPCYDKQGTQVSPCFNGSAIEASTSEPATPAPSDVLDYAENMLAWCVKNVDMWHFPEWDRLDAAVKSARALAATNEPGAAA